MAHPSDSIVGTAPSISALRDQICHLAAFDRPASARVPTVLLVGETGTGKGLVARLVHDSGARAKGPFVDVNCAAIPETMLEAELFGFEAGAFTDARRAKPGLFEAASGGTLFLDEIDALPFALQGKLLKAIEEKSIRRLGAIAAHPVDVKLVAATQQDLREMVAARAFRADLFHRLAVVILEIPPLRVRGDDVLVLAEHFVAQHARAHGLAPKRLTDAARVWLRVHDWPGNVRELSHLMERATLLCPEDALDHDALERLRVPFAPAAPPLPVAAAEDHEPTRIRAALARAGGNVVRAAQLLGLGRNALRGRMRRYGIGRPTLDDLARAPKPPARAAKAVSPRPTASGRRGPESVEASWEQKLVAVLAIELMLPEGAYEPWTVARRWRRLIEEHLGSYGGVFLARTPSHLTAVFGIPRALEQLSERAVQSALALRRLAAAEEPARRPELRMALHAGTVHLDTHAADPLATLLAVGDTVALPERLLGHAAAGEILASAPFARRIEARCELRARELRVGEAETLRAAAVVGHAPTGHTALPAETGFVGRGHELGSLREAFESAAAGHGQLVLLVGEPGLGKSRLLTEFRGRLGGAAHLWVEGHCASYGTAAAFHPLIDALRRLLDIDDHDDAASAAAKVERGVRTVGEDLAWTLPFVRQVLSLEAGDEGVVGMDAASRRSETFRALKAIMLRAAEQQPLVVVVEDLHWIDPASEEYLTFLTEALPATRALLVCSYRPGYRHPFGDRTYHVRLSLRALSRGEMADITDSLLGAAEVPAELRTLIAEKAEGNPFFVEEVTRSLLEDGSLRRENGRVVLARELAEITVPDTIQDVLIVRIDRLADEARRAIQVASVIGREFALRLLERIADAGARVRTHVDELRALELIYEKAAHPELAYMFKHALTHDVAYASVLVDRRRQLHRTIGLAIEELYADRLAEFYETLAHHFERAEEWDRALDYHEHAAEKAADHFANRAVIAHCRAALAIAERLGARVPDDRRRRLEERNGLASFLVSEFAGSGEAFARAAERSSGAAERALNLAQAGFSHFWAHRYGPADAATAQALELARRHGLRGLEGLALGTQGFFRGVCGGEVEEEERLARDGLRLCEAGGSDDGALAMLRFYLAMLAEWRGDYRRSITLSDQVIAAGRRLSLPHLVVWPGWFLGKAHCCLGDYGRALAQLEEAADVCERIGDRAWKSRLLNTLGWCLAEIGSHTRARDFNARAWALAREIGDPEIVSNSEINLVVDNLALGDVERALAHLEPVREALGRPGDPWMRWRYALHALDAEGRLALARRDPERALVCARDEITGARRHQAPKVEARALVLAGEALLAMDSHDDAERDLAEALGIAERIGYPRAVWVALGRLAEARRRAGRTAAAEEAAARKRRVVERLAGSIGDAGLRGELVVEAGA